MVIKSHSDLPALVELRRAMAVRGRKVNIRFHTSHGEEGEVLERMFRDLDWELRIEPDTEQAVS